MVEPARQTPKPEEGGTAESARALEAFARDLLILTKTFSVYPDGHPAPRRVAERIAEWTLPDGRRDLSLGFTPTRLLLEQRFFGTPGSRCEALAAHFHARKIMRLTWASGVAASDVSALSSVMASTRLDGAELREAVRSRGCVALDLEPLDATKIHGALSLGSAADRDSKLGEERSLQAWLWLQGGAVRAEDLAEALRSPGFWAEGREDPPALVALLLRHQGKLGAALGFLPEEDRRAARERMAEAPRSLTVAELAAILLNEADVRNLAGEGTPILLEGLTPEGLMDLLAEMVAAGGGVTGRIEALFRCMAPRWDVENMLSVVEARLASGESGGHAADSWRAIQSFLLDLEEGQFFGDDYLAKLDAASREGGQEGAGGPGTRLAEEVESHVDWVCLALAAEGDADAVGRLRRRLSARMPELSPRHALSLARAATASVPDALAGQHEVVAALFERVISGVRALDDAEREACVRLARDHEGAVLDLVLSSLVRERRIAGRKFLVDVLSALSAETTAAMMAKACTAPWFFLRNIVTVLGRRGERSATPVLGALLSHPHDKVRRETLKSLCAVGGAARRLVEAFADDPAKKLDERHLARRLLARKAPSP